MIFPISQSEMWLSGNNWAQMDYKKPVKETQILALRAVTQTCYVSAKEIRSVQHYWANWCYLIGLRARMVTLWAWHVTAGVHHMLEHACQIIWLTVHRNILTLHTQTGLYLRLIQICSRYTAGRVLTHYLQKASFTIQFEKDYELFICLFSKTITITRSFFFLLWPCTNVTADKLEDRNNFSLFLYPVSSGFPFQEYKYCRNISRWIYIDNKCNTMVRQ